MQRTASANGVAEAMRATRAETMRMHARFMTTGLRTGKYDKNFSNCFDKFNRNGYSNKEKPTEFYIFTQMTAHNNRNKKQQQ